MAGIFPTDPKCSLPFLSVRWETYSTPLASVLSCHSCMAFIVTCCHCCESLGMEVTVFYKSVCPQKAQLNSGEGPICTPNPNQTRKFQNTRAEEEDLGERGREWGQGTGRQVQSPPTCARGRPLRV